MGFIPYEQLHLAQLFIQVSIVSQAFMLHTLFVNAVELFQFYTEFMPL